MKRGGGGGAQQVIKMIAPGTFQLMIHAKPGARTTSVERPDVPDVPVEMRVAAQPEGGRANKEIVEYLDEMISRHFSPPKRVDVSVLHGMTSRNKIVQITFDGTAEELWQALLES